MDNVASKNNNKPARKMVQLRFVLMPIFIIILAVFALIVIASLAPKPAKKPIEVKAPLVEAAPLQRKDISFSIASQGSVLPRTETMLISEVSGNVVSVSKKFEVGGFFRKGETLLKIDDISYKVALLQAESALESALAELEQEKARGKQAKDEWLLTGQSIAEAPSLALRTPQLKMAKAAVKSAQAGLTDAKTKLERTHIRAPYDALLKIKHVDIGQFVSIGSSIATTFAIDYAEVRLPVKQRDIAFLNLPKLNPDVKNASTIELYQTVNNEKQTWQARLARYEGVVDMTSRVHYVVAQLNDPYGILNGQRSDEIRIGTFVNADIVGKTIENLYAIPRQAVHGSNTLYLVDQENKLHIQQVDVLRADVDAVYTQDSIADNLRLVVTNLETPVEGMSLRISGEPEPQIEDIAKQEENAGDQS